MTEKRVTILLGLCSGVLFLWLLLLIRGVPFICPDDMAIASDRFRMGGLLNASLEITRSTGRFYQVLIYSATQLPYLVDSFVFTNIIRAMSAAVPIIAFGILVTLLLESLPLALFSVMILCALVQTVGSYNSLFSLPLWFNLGLGIVFLSYALFYVACVRRSHRLNVFAALAFLIGSLSYESMLLYGIGFPLILLKTRTLKDWKTLVPIGCSYAVYLAMYFAFKNWIGQSYPGTQPTLTSLNRIVSTVYTFSGNGLNLQPWTFFHGRLLISEFLLSMVVFTATFLLGVSMVNRRIIIRPSKWFFLVSVLYWLLPNILYGLVERYRHWAESDPMYLGNFFASFGFALLLVLAFIWMVNCASRVGRRVGTAVVVLLSFTFGLLTYGNTAFAERAYSDYRANGLYWAAINDMVSRGGFDRIQDGDVIVSPSLVYIPFLPTDFYNYWELYIGEKIGRKFTIVPTRDAPRAQGGKNFFVMRLHTNRTSALVALGERTADDLGSNVDIYGFPLDKEVRVSFRTTEGNGVRSATPQRIAFRPPGPLSLKRSTERQSTIVISTINVEQ